MKNLNQKETNLISTGKATSNKKQMRVTSCKNLNIQRQINQR